MRRRYVSAVICLVVLAPLLDARQAQASVICESALPFNIDAGMLEPQLIALLQRSSTFRRQCAVIAATRILRVTIRLRPKVQDARAETTINRFEAGAIRAEVTVRFSEDYLEVLPHEFEHIVEQVEGVSLTDEVAAGRAWVTRTGAFETRRAAMAGIAAREECDTPAAHQAVSVALQVDARRLRQ